MESVGDKPMLDAERSTGTKWHRAIAREPLAQFFCVGVLLFAAQRGVEGSNQDADNADVQANRTIAISAAQIEAAESDMERRSKMPLSEEQRRAVAETLVREEIYYREAMALGLDRGDPIIRRRLTQKMQFLTEDRFAAAVPTDDELRAFIANSPRRYMRPHRISFDQVFFSRARREDPEAEAIRFLAEVDPTSSDPPSGGDPFMHGSDIKEASETSVNRMFGRGFADALFEQAEGEWSEPIMSTYGVHVVFIHKLKREGERPLDEVREVATRDWRRVQAGSLRDSALAKLRDQYTVQIEGRPDASE